MAAVTGRERMIKSMNELTGRGDCTEAILAQERPSWTPFVLVPLAVVIAFVLGAALNVSTILLGAIVGLLIGGGFALTTTYWILARVGNDVMLARSSKLSAKAVELVDQWPAPMQIEQKKGLLQNRIGLGGHSLIIARQFSGRASEIVA